MMKSMLTSVLAAVLLGPGAAGGEELINRRDEARKAVLVSPANIYRHYCEHCHGEEGKGNGRLWATELEHKPTVLSQSKADKSYLIEAIREGSAVHEGKSNLCAPWGRTISAENIDRLAQHIISFRGGMEPASSGEPVPASADSGSAGPDRESFPWLIVFVLMVEVVVLWKLFGKRKQAASQSP